MLTSESDSSVTNDKCQDHLFHTRPTQGGAIDDCIKNIKRAMVLMKKKREGVNTLPPKKLIETHIDIGFIPTQNIPTITTNMKDLDSLNEESKKLLGKIFTEKRTQLLKENMDITKFVEIKYEFRLIIGLETDLANADYFTDMVMIMTEKKEVFNKCDVKETQNICSSVEQLQSSQESASLSSADDSDADPAYAEENYENFSESSIDSDMECRFSLTEPKARKKTIKKGERSPKDRQEKLDSHSETSTPSRKRQHTIEDIAYGDSSEDDEQTHYASWNKQMASDWCLYCKQLFTSRISRHYKCQHQERSLVQEAILLPDKQQQKVLYKLQQLGNYQHNCTVIAAGEGELVVNRRPTVPLPAYQFLPCTICLGFFNKETLSDHVRKCPLANKSMNPTNASQEGYLMLVPHLPKSTQLETKILLGKKETKENRGLLAIIKKDELIKLFGINQLLRMGENLRFSDINNICNKLKSLARLLQAVRAESETWHDFMSYYCPKYYDCFVRASTGLSKKSSQLGLTLGHYVKQLCHLRIAVAVKASDTDGERSGEQFLKLCMASWTTNVVSAICKRQRLAKLNQVINLPLTADLLKLTKFIDREVSEQLASLTNRVWLVKLVISALILFNKRRPMEVQDLKVADYRLSLAADQEQREEITNNLSVEEKLVASRC
ncbi:uncharacterized protein [Watersipora subatra]|uniref:uncharacterized protein n=1 Tax=Watersipora subatra TaxID=2589382 RepID=UPI00355C3C7E